MNKGVVGVCLMCAALGATRARARDLGDILVEKGLITAAELAEARAEEHRQTEAEAKRKAEEESQRQTAAATIPKWIEAITLFGDVRTRHEGFYEDGLIARNRFRLRARIGANVNVSDELGATVRLATGNSDDPLSSNQSLERTFTSKPINLDHAFVTFRPGKTFGIDPTRFTVTAGKSGINAYRTSELLWDDDLAPEGASQTLTLFERRDGFLRALRFNALQWVVDELSAAEEPWMFGGQVVAETAVGSAASWTVAVADFYYANLDQVARKFLEKTSSSFNRQLNNSNALVRDTKGAVVGFASDFNIIHGASEISFSDPFGLGIPAGLFVDIAHNTQADTRNVGVYAGIGLGRAGGGWYRNRLGNAGDWGAAFTYAWVEQDAVPSLFTYSDIEYVQSRATQDGSTNVVAGILRLDYVPLQNVQLTAKAHFINALDLSASSAFNAADRSKSLDGNPTLIRTQLDAALRF